MYQAPKLYSTWSPLQPLWATGEKASPNYHQSLIFACITLCKPLEKFPKALIGYCHQQNNEKSARTKTETVEPRVTVDYTWHRWTNILTLYWYHKSQQQKRWILMSEKNDRKATICCQVVHLASAGVHEKIINPNTEMYCRLSRQDERTGRKSPQYFSNQRT